ncbi:hypothetical protein Tco_0697808 [Tanacetum coccineum]
MESSNSKERELQLTQRLVKQRHSHCMAWFEQLETHLRDLYLNSSSHVVDAFKPAFHSFFGEEHQTFRLKMFHNLDQLRLQLERENLLEVNPRTCLDALRTLFKEFFASKRVNSSEHLNQCWQKDFKEYTLCEPDTYRRDLLENLDTLEAVIHRAVITYGRLQLQSQDVQINPVQAVDDSLNVSKSSWIESENHNALSKSVNETQLQQHESLITESTTLEANLNPNIKALDARSVITEISETKSDKHDTSSSSGTFITHAVDADIRPVNDQVPFAEVQLTAQHNVLANEQQHTEQSEPNYDTYLLEKVDSNTTSDSTNMCHRGGEIDQDAELYQAKSPLLKAEFLKTNDMVEKEVYNELSNRFLQLEKHCISLEISMQQKEESFQSNKPCKNQDAPEFREFFEINDLKAQLQAKTTLICNLKNQIKSVKEASNEAKEKVFANVALKNELRKLKGNNMDTKFAKPSILGKPVLQPPRNQSVVRQPNAFKSERPNFSKPRFASQVDVNNILSKPVTPYYLPKVREYVLAKPHHVIAPGSFRNSQEEPYGSNDMAHNHYLEEARKKTQERNRNSKPSVMHTTSLQNTTNGSKPNTRSNNQISRSLPVSKSSCGMSNDTDGEENIPAPEAYKMDEQIHSCSEQTQTSLGHSLHQQIPFYLHSAVLGTSTLTHDAKTGRSLLHDNIIPKPDLALELGKSISLTEAEKEAVAREVHATHARIASLFNDKMTSVHISSSLALQRHMASADNTSGPVPQSKERCTLQCALSLEEEKSSCL